MEYEAGTEYLEYDGVVNAIHEALQHRRSGRVSDIGVFVAGGKMRTEVLGDAEVSPTVLNVFPTGVNNYWRFGDPSDLFDQTWDMNVERSETPIDWQYLGYVGCVVVTSIVLAHVVPLLTVPCMVMAVCATWFAEDLIGS